MNLSNPEPIKSNEKKVSVFGKIWAGINLIALFGDFVMPKSSKNNISIMWRNIAIIFSIFVLGYFIGCGIFINVRWIIYAISGISFSLGEGFYYFGYIVFCFTLIDIFKLEKKVSDFVLQKNIVTTAMNSKEINKQISNTSNILNTSFKKDKIYNAIASVMGALTFFWMLWGIFFYDTILFIILFSFSFVYPFFMMLLKKIPDIKKAFIIENSINAILLIFILIHHFYF